MTARTTHESGSVSVRPMNDTNRAIYESVLASPVGKALRPEDVAALEQALAGDADPREVRGWLGDQIRKAAVLKGDFVGHPFRGNQYTTAEGQSRGGASPSASNKVKAGQERRARNARADVAARENVMRTTTDELDRAVSNLTDLGGKVDRIKADASSLAQRAVRDAEQATSYDDKSSADRSMEELRAHRRVVQMATEAKDLITKQTDIMHIVRSEVGRAGAVSGEKVLELHDATSKLTERNYRDLDRLGKKLARMISSEQSAMRLGRSNAYAVSQLKGIMRHVSDVLDESAEVSDVIYRLPDTLMREEIIQRDAAKQK